MQCWIPADFGSMGSRSPCCATACRVTDVRGVDAGGSDDHPAPRSSWAFLTNHAHVLLCIVRDPRVRLRDVATMVGITERAAQSIVADLVGEGYLSRQRVGRRNVYEVHRHTPLRRRNHQPLHDTAYSGLVERTRPDCLPRCTPGSRPCRRCTDLCSKHRPRSAGPPGSSRHHRRRSPPSPPGPWMPPAQFPDSGPHPTSNLRARP